MMQRQRILKIVRRSIGSGGSLMRSLAGEPQAAAFSTSSIESSHPPELVLPRDKG